jgi:hypothetical protein
MKLDLDHPGRLIVAALIHAGIICAGLWRALDFLYSFRGVTGV